MKQMYNLIAGQSLERLGALSDGVFAIAMTLLILEIHVPELETGAGDWELLLALSTLGPKFLMFFTSMMTAGIFWVGQQTQLSNLARANRDLVWIHLVFLSFVSTLPFTTALLGEHIELRSALLIYWANVALLGGLLLASWLYAERNRLLAEDVTPDFSAAIKRRIVIAQALYAFAVTLCFFSPLLSIALIMIIQLNYVVAPKIFGLDRI